MLLTREILESREQSLASYAQRSAESVGRTIAEPKHRLRTSFQRDRARVIHSRAFRRLEYKTQVFLNGTGDHLRTRLTHTMEVASVSRAVASALGLNSDLAEVVALAHDLGHAPFGHAGEHALDACMAEHGGFEHNLQSLRVVERMERTYPNFDGLNLTYESMEGLRKHDLGYHRPASQEAGGTPAEAFPNPSMEGQIADYCDEIAYYSHDLDDGLEHQLISLDQLAEVELWAECMKASQKAHPNRGREDLVKFTVRNLIDREVDDLVQTTHNATEDAGINSADAARRHSERIVRYSPKMAALNKQLRAFLYTNLYGHPEVSEANQRGRDRITAVFNYYVENSAEMGDITIERIEEEGLHRCVCDYVAGMTDLYLIGEFERIIG